MTGKRTFGEFKSTGKDLRKIGAASALRGDLFHMKKTPPQENAEDGVRHKYTQSHYLKKSLTWRDGDWSAKREVAVLEFLRLMIPRQPKARVIADENNSFYVQTNEVPNSESLAQTSENIGDELHQVYPKLKDASYGSDHGYKGLGELDFMMNMVFIDQDQAGRNLLVDESGMLYRIDCEMTSFRPIKIVYMFIPDSKDRLLQSYFAQDLMHENNTAPYINKFYREEYIRALVLFLLLPEMVLKQFAKTYGLPPSFHENLYQTQQKLYDLYTKIHDKKLLSLLSGDDDITLIANMKNDIDNFKQHILSFKVKGKTTLISLEQQQEISDEIDSRFITLQHDCAASAGLDGQAIIENMIKRELEELEATKAPEKEESSSEQVKARIRKAVYKACNKLKQWRDGQLNENSGPHRGASGFFTWARHAWSYHQKSGALHNDLQSCSQLKDMHNLINHFLESSSTRYHRHSFSSFLLDELKQIKDSPWADIQLRDDGNYVKEDVQASIQNYDVNNELGATNGPKSLIATA